MVDLIVSSIVMVSITLVSFFVELFLIKKDKHPDKQGAWHPTIFLAAVTLISIVIFCITLLL